MGSGIKKCLYTAEGNIPTGISPVRVFPIIVFSIAYLAVYVRFGSGSRLPALLYYAVTFMLCMANYGSVREFLQLPFRKSSLPVFSGRKTDLLLTYPLLLTASISIISSLLVLAGIVPKYAQQLSSMGMTFNQLLQRVPMLPAVAFVEEFCNLLLAALVYRALAYRLKAGYRLAASVLAAAFVFGFLHAFSWNLSTAVMLAVSFIPVIFMTLYLKSIWVSVLAHFYNDLLATAGLYSAAGSRLILGALLLPCLIGAAREMLHSGR